jgi:hypothetical protein
VLQPSIGQDVVEKNEQEKPQYSPERFASSHHGIAFHPERVNMVVVNLSLYPPLFLSLCFDLDSIIVFFERSIHFMNFDPTHRGFLCDFVGNLLCLGVCRSIPQ